MKILMSISIKQERIMGGGVGRLQRSPASTQLPRVPGVRKLGSSQLRTRSPTWSPNSPSHTLNESTGGKPCQVGRGQHHPCFLPHLAGLSGRAAPPTLGGTQCGHWTPAPVHTRNPQARGWITSKIKRT